MGEESVRQISTLAGEARADLDGGLFTRPGKSRAVR